MKKKITILGSTGSIGENALKIIQANTDKFEIVALSGHSNYKRLAEQIEMFQPKYVSIGTEEGYKELSGSFPNTKVLLGEEGLKELGSLDETDTILTAVSGSIGLAATIEAIKKEKRIALANKETLVAGGYLIKKLLNKYNSEIIPVDSEHSAIFQSLKSGNDKEISRIINSIRGSL